MENTLSYTHIASLEWIETMEPPDAMYPHTDPERNHVLLLGEIANIGHIRERLFEKNLAFTEFTSFGECDMVAIANLFDNVMHQKKTMNIYSTSVDCAFTVLIAYMWKEFDLNFTDIYEAVNAQYADQCPALVDINKYLKNDKHLMSESHELGILFGDQFVDAIIPQKTHCPILHQCCQNAIKTDNVEILGSLLFLENVIPAYGRNEFLQLANKWNSFKCFEFLLHQPDVIIALNTLIKNINNESLDENGLQIDTLYNKMLDKMLIQQSNRLDLTELDSTTFQFMDVSCRCYEILLKYVDIELPSVLRHIMILASKESNTKLFARTLTKYKQVIGIKTTAVPSSPEDSDSEDSDRGRPGFLNLSLDAFSRATTIFK
jgi:hypothetical protein